MKRPVVFMYSGQGAQYYQMGRELYHQDPVFKQWIDRCGEIVAPMIGVSLTDIIYGTQARKADLFDRTLYTHPANVIFGVALTRCLESHGVRPDLILGYSLGEYTASIITGARDLEAGLAKIVGQANLLEKRCVKAGMMAILDHPNIMDRRADLFQGCWLAAHNFETHFVITGPTERIAHIDRVLKNERAVCQVLPTSHGFHSPLVDPIGEEFRRLMDGFAPIQIPVISPVVQGPLTAFSGDHCWRVLREPVPFLETVRAMERKGPHLYVDVGPAGTMSTFVKYNLQPGSRSKALPVLSPFGKDLAGLNLAKNALESAAREDGRG